LPSTLIRRTDFFEQPARVDPKIRAGFGAGQLQE
jgi:hypothetical protein